jgi:hypothetical protein
MLIGVGDAAKMLGFELVWGRSWRRIATLREVDDKVVSLFISSELQKGSAFSIFTEPFGIGGGFRFVLCVGASFPLDETASLLVRFCYWDV